MITNGPARAHTQDPGRVRFLSDYNTAFISKRYPLMGFLYAIYAGGEHTVYCDYSIEFFTKYCIEPFQSKGLPVPDYIKRVGARLGEFEKATEGRTVVVHANARDWDLFLASLKEEMLATEGPEPAW